jgi:hypothetical protein
MGVDIDGKKYKDHPEYTDDHLYEERRAFEDTHPGAYFRANWWSWRPIHDLCDRAFNSIGKRYDTQLWGYNDGAGLETQAECDELANAIERLIQGLPNDSRHDLELESDLRVDEDNRFTRDDTGRTPWSTNTAHVREWVSFLRDCGGFEIW